jgi:hypothetical protein
MTTTVRHLTTPPLLALLVALAPGAAVAVEPAIHAEATLGFDTNPLREAGGEQGVYPFLGAIVDAGMVHGGEKTTLRAALSEGARVFWPDASDADVLASRLDLEGAWVAGKRLELGGSLALRDLSELGGVRSETGGQLHLDARLRFARFDVDAGGGLSALYPRTRRLENFASIGPDAGLGLGFSPVDGQHVRIGWELHVRNYPDWPLQERDDIANVGTLEWTRRGSLIAGAGYSLTGNHSSVPGGTYFRNRIWVRAATELPWEVTLAALGSLQWSNYPGGLISEAERLLAENDERENALELRFSRVIGADVEAVLKVAAYGGEFSHGGGNARLEYRREVIQLSIGWRPE